MTTPTGQISMSQVLLELGQSGAISFGSSSVRTLAGKPSGAISMNDMRGKAAMTVYVNNRGASNISGASLYNTHTCTVTGGSGTISYSWSLNTNGESGVSINGSTTSSTCQITSNTPGWTGSQTVLITCTVTRGSSTASDQATSSFSWTSGGGGGGGGGESEL